MQRRLGTIDALRGLAAFSVAWFHFTNGGPLLANGVLKSSGHYGWVGVEMFFVISGFIIPYSLYRAGYQGSDFSRFLLKRITRLDPPYIADILLIIAISYLVPFAPGFRGEWPHYTATQLLCHLGYVNSIVGKPWVNIVFWSLGIEFQYYLLIGVLFPLLVDRRRSVRFGFLFALILLAILIRRYTLVFVWFPLFVSGILTFQRKAELISTKTMLGGLLVTGTVCWLVNGHLVSIVVIATALVIAFVEIPSSRLTDLGLISYSMYLLHVPIGGKIVNLGSRWAHTLPAQLLVLAAAVAGTIAASWVFYRFIELPSQRLSSSVRYRGRRAQHVIEPAVLVAAAAGQVESA
ncbi:MAG: acyltransferase family protein [Terriglobales bacterium]